MAIDWCFSFSQAIVRFEDPDEGLRDSLQGGEETVTPEMQSRELRVRESGLTSQQGVVLNVLYQPAFRGWSLGYERRDSGDARHDEGDGSNAHERARARSQERCTTPNDRPDAKCARAIVRPPRGGLAIDGVRSTRRRHDAAAQVIHHEHGRVRDEPLAGDRASVLVIDIAPRVRAHTAHLHGAVPGASREPPVERVPSVRGQGAAVGVHITAGLRSLRDAGQVALRGLRRIDEARLGVPVVGPLAVATGRYDTDIVGWLCLPPDVAA
jgi:hypothetical protein